MRYLLCVALLLTACASYEPQPIEGVPFKERAKTQTLGRVSVSAVVLSAEESRAVFGRKLAKKKIQPVWLRIENAGEEPLVFLPVGLDSNYYAPGEAAHLLRVSSSEANARMRSDYEQLAIRLRVPAGGVSEGFVLTPLDEGAKVIHVDLLVRGELERLVFVFRVPGIDVDFDRIDFNEIYKPGDVRDLDDASLRQVLERMPRAALGKRNGREGDPLNIVVIGKGEDLLSAFVRRGWDLTEALGGGSSWKTIGAFIFGSRYRYSPISPLYVFDRPQDVGFQKARATIHERNHLRLWMTPYRFEGKQVWIGQISRDIGVKFTLKSPTIATHKIDPDVDEARIYLVQDLIYSGNITAFGWVEGVGASTPEAPRENFTGDAYTTDGLRAVFVLGPSDTEVANIRLLNWETSPLAR